MDCQIYKQVVGQLGMSASPWSVTLYLYLFSSSSNLCVFVRHWVVPHSQLASLDLRNCTWGLLRSLSLWLPLLSWLYKSNLNVTSLSESFKDIAFQILKQKKSVARHHFSIRYLMWKAWDIVFLEQSFLLDSLIKSMFDVSHPLKVGRCGGTILWSISGGWPHMCGHAQLPVISFSIFVWTVEVAIGCRVNCRASTIIYRVLKFMAIIN